MKQTPVLKTAETKNEWLIVDAAGIPLGRLASTIAIRLRGKHKPNYTAHVDNGDHVIVINAEKIKLTGHKMQNMEYKYHTGFVGGLKAIVAGDQLKGAHPERLVERAVERMLPKESPLARDMFRKLHVYKGENHPHAAQAPKSLKLGKKEGVR